MKGFKVVAEDHNHHGFVYKQGLNIDSNKFNPEGSCVSGGLYFFTDIKDVIDWVDYGVYLYEVEVPDRYQCVQDPDMDKYRASALILSNPLDLRKVSTWEYLIQQGVSASSWVLTHLLDWSLKQKNIGLSKYCIKLGAELDSRVYNFLALSARRGHTDSVKLLVEAGADVNLDNSLALRWAAERGYLDVVRCLVEKGADIHANHDEALHWAALHGHLEVVKFLVEQGADIHTSDEYALRYAASYGHLDVVEYLVESGADIHAQDDYALNMATRSEHTHVIEYLKRKY